MTRSIVGWALALAASAAQPATAMPLQAEPGEGPAAGLVVLSETGEFRDGLPVLTKHDSSSAIAASLRRGFGEVALRLFQMEQRYLQIHDGTAPEPAYLLLSGNEGGFPRFGFYLNDERKAGVGFVDLHRSKPLSGRFGASDQIFPHELAHVLLIQLAGPPGNGGSNQVHAIGVRTDPSYAFHEGFAEHFQVVAIDHPEAAPDTRALAADFRRVRQVRENLESYRKEISARWAPLGRLRMTFPLWYSGAEQLLRYHAVKENLFAREAPIPERLLGSRDPYKAYLLGNVLPGPEGSFPRSRRRMESTEGVVASFFVRWVESAGLRNIRREDSFYERFGVNGDAVTPTENVYLKLFHAMYRSKPGTVAELIEGYRQEFPDESVHIDSVVEQAFLGQGPAGGAELWLANPDFFTGTSLFDQLRALPRTHTFDLNGASLSDLVSVPGVNLELARRILRGGPYDDLDQLAGLDGMSAELLRRFETMRTEMAALISSSEDREAGLSLGSILRPYLVRLVVMLILASILGAALHRVLRRGSEQPEPSRLRLGMNGLAASTMALLGGWMLGGVPLVYALGTVALVFGTPAALMGLFKTRRVRPALWLLAAWIGAAFPMALLVSPLL